MLNFDRTVIENFLSRLEEEGYLFSGYRLYRKNGRLRLLGKGGFSAVYEMEKTGAPERRYALKVMGLERHTVTSEGFRETIFLQRCLSSKSPRILGIIDVKEIRLSLDENGEPSGIYEKQEENWNGESFPLQLILMEKLECILAKDKFKNITLIHDSLQEEAEILKLAIQVGEAVEIAHNNNVLHRDIKLENIFWDEKEKSYKLGDFGIAKYVEEGNAETIVYTDGYGAPEIERRLTDSYNATADIYSFGISLYLLLNGLRFPGSGGYYVNLVQYDPNFVFPAPEKASDGLTRVIRKMCSYRREDRYQTMAEVLFDLRYAAGAMEAAEDEGEDESDDLETETYREEKEDGNGSLEEASADSKEPVKPGRARRKEGRKMIDQDYNRACGRYMVAFSVLFVLLFQGTQKDLSSVAKWQFWVLPLLVLVTAIMQQIGDFHVLSGVITVLFGIYSVRTVGFGIPHLILILCVLIGIPALTASGAVGTGVWILLTLTGQLPLSGFFAGRTFSWGVAIILFILVNRLIGLKWEWQENREKTEKR